MSDEIKEKGNKSVETTSPAPVKILRKNRKIIPTALQYKHPLEFEWTLWYFENNKLKDWNENQREVYTFSTVEDFWSLFTHIRPVAELRNGCDYSIFKKGIRPMWEDAQNKRGGRWLITLEKRQRTGNLDSYWLELLLLMIGGSLEGNKNDLCGAVVNVRPKFDKISIWTGDAENIEGIRDIGSVMREGLLNLPRNIVIGYQAHTDNINKSNSSVKNRLTV